jgi:hypothetical protein
MVKGEPPKLERGSVDLWMLVLKLGKAVDEQLEEEEGDSKKLEEEEEEEEKEEEEGESRLGMFSLRVGVSTFFLTSL